VFPAALQEDQNWKKKTKTKTASLLPCDGEEEEENRIDWKTRRMERTLMDALVVGGMIKMTCLRYWKAAESQ
jgi:hypothetical protein